MTKPDFEKKKFGPNLGILGPNLPKFGVFSHFREFESLDFSNFAYFNRKTWYLTDSGGHVAEKNFEVKFGPNLELYPNYFCLQIRFLDIYSSFFFHFAYYDRQQWYLPDSGGISTWKKI